MIGAAALCVHEIGVGGSGGGCKGSGSGGRGEGEGHLAEVLLLGVRPGWRGAGGSVAILAEIEKVGKSRGWTAIFLEVAAAPNSNQVLAYTKRGYELATRCEYERFSKVVIDDSKLHNPARRLEHVRMSLDYCCLLVHRLGHAAE